MREARAVLPLLVRAWRARVAAAAVDQPASASGAPAARLLAAPRPSSPPPIAPPPRPTSSLPSSLHHHHHQQRAGLSSSSPALQKHKEQKSLPSLSDLLNNTGSAKTQQPQQQKKSGNNNNGKSGNNNGKSGGNNNNRAAAALWSKQQMNHRLQREGQERRERIAAGTQAAAEDTAYRLAARLEMFEGGSSRARGDGRRKGGGGGGKGGGGARAAAPAGRQQAGGKHFQPLDRKQRDAAAAEERQKTRAAAAQQVAGRWASRLQELQQQTQGAGAGAAEASSSAANDQQQEELEEDHHDLQKSKSSTSTSDPSSTPALREVLLSAADAEPGALTARRLAALLGCGAARVERALADLGEPVKSEEDPVALDAAELAALELGAALILPSGGAGGEQAEPAAASSSSSQSLLILEPRPPVVTVMGHVDHGKTSLLDALRRTDVAAGEAGGITQHIGAFSVELPGSSRRITFLDTPGHAAFGAMRARGAAVTDMVVLVVAADDGPMPQTVEALAHARAAGCPVVVAITKCDAVPPERPGQVKARLAAELELELEDFGGTVQCVETALPKGGGELRGLRELEEALLLQAEVMELKAARRQRRSGGVGGADGGYSKSETVRVPASGTVVEAHVERGMGPVATVVVQRGELRVGDVVVCGSAFGRVRALRGGGDTAAAVGPGEHALVSGLRSLPSAGDELAVVSDEDRAARIARARLARAQDYARASLLRARHASAERRRAAQAADAARKKALLARLLELRTVKRHKMGELNRTLAEYRALMAGKAGAAGGEGVGSAAAAAGAAAGADEGRSEGGDAAAADAPASDNDNNDNNDDDDDDPNNPTNNAPHPDAPVVPFIIKADVQGSAEAVRDALMALPARGTAAAAVVLCAVGPPSLSDAHLAAATGARLLAFNVRPAGADVEAAIKNGGVRVMEHNVIYRLLDDVRELLEREGALAAAAAAGGGGGEGGGGAFSGGQQHQQGEREVVVGSGTVLQTFPLLRKGKNVGTVAGLGVSAGSLVRSDAAGSAAATAAAAAALAAAAKDGGAKSSSSNATLPPGAQVARLEYRLVRDGQVVASGLPCSDLRRQKLDVESVGKGTQCGAALDGGAWGGEAPRPGDVVECVAVVRGG
jgi:translation initiation factor IF-2